MKKDSLISRLAVPTNGLGVASYLFVLFMLTVFPIYINPDYTCITAEKCKAFVFLSAVFLAFTFIWLLVNSVLNRRRGKKISVSRPDFGGRFLPIIFALLFYVMQVLSSLFSSYSGAVNNDGNLISLYGAGRYDGLIISALYIAVFVVTACCGRFESLHVAFLAVIVAFMCIVGIVQLYGINAFTFYPAGGYSGYYDKFISTIGNVDFMSAFLCAAVPLIVTACVVMDFYPLTRVLLVISGALGLFVMLSIDVDSGKIAFAVCAAIMLPVVLRGKQSLFNLLLVACGLLVAVAAAHTVKFAKGSGCTICSINYDFNFLAVIGVLILLMIAAMVVIKLVPSREYSFKPVRIIVASLEAVLLVAGILFLKFAYVPSTNSGVLYELSAALNGNITEYSGSHRIGIWKYSFLMALKNPVIGTGTGTYQKAINEFSCEVGFTFYIDKGMNLDAAHNEYLQILCTNGILGLVSYLGLLISILVTALRNLARNPKIIVLGAGVLGYAIQAFFTFSIVIVSPIFWTLLGLLVYEISVTRKKSAEKVPETEII